MGTQFFTADSPEFRKQASTWEQLSLITDWQGKLSYFNGNCFVPASQRQRYVACDGMSSLAKDLSKGLNISLKHQAIKVSKSLGHWNIFCHDLAEPVSAKRIILAMPYQQISELLRNSEALEASSWLKGLADFKPMIPCVAGLYIFKEASLLPFSGCFIKNRDIDFLADNYAKAGIKGKGTSMSVHASPQLSRKWAKNPVALQEEHLLRLVENFISKKLPNPTYQASHLWRYAKNSGESPFESQSSYSRELELGVCGDWHVGGRLEGAYLSGLDMASKLLDA